MRPKEPTYTIGEIALATGIKNSVLSARRKKNGIPPAERGGGVHIGTGEADGEAAQAETGL